VGVRWLQKALRWNLPVDQYSKAPLTSTTC